MRLFSYAWSLTVTWQRWRSCQKPHAARKLHGSTFSRNRESTEVLYCGNRFFLLFCSCDLDLDL